MIRTIQTTYRYRLQPTAQQEALFRQFAGARCFGGIGGLLANANTIRLPARPSPTTR